MRALAIMKQCSAQASETATEDQASDHSHQNKTQRSQFELDVQEAPPTSDQVNNILEYLGNGKASQLVKGATSSADVKQKLKQDPDSFHRPVVCLSAICSVLSLRLSHAELEFLPPKSSLAHRVLLGSELITIDC